MIKRRKKLSYEPYTCTSILSMRIADILIHIAAHSIIVDINISVQLLFRLINGTRLYEMTLEILELKRNFWNAKILKNQDDLLFLWLCHPKTMKMQFLVLSDKGEEDQMSSTPRAHGSTYQFLFR